MENINIESIDDLIACMKSDLHEINNNIGCDDFAETIWKLTENIEGLLDYLQMALKYEYTKRKNDGKS